MSWEHLKVFSRKSLHHQIIIDFADGGEVLYFIFSGNKLFWKDTNKQIFLHCDKQYNSIEMASLEDSNIPVNIKTVYAWLHGHPMCWIKVNGKPMYPNGIGGTEFFNDIDSWFDKTYKNEFSV